MRHWKPYIRQTVAQIAAEGYQSGIALCMAPHASKMSSGAYKQKLMEALEEQKAPLKIGFIESWYDQPFLIQALAKKVRSAVEQFPVETRPEIHYLFTAHSLPASLQEQGDPYAAQLQQTARLLAEELKLQPEQWSFGYQSAGAAAGAWLGPSIEDMLPQFAEAGFKNLLVTPVGFMADHVEILYDLDIEAQEIAKAHGIRMVRSESLNASPDFIEGLAKFILERSTSQLENGSKPSQTRSNHRRRNSWPRSSLHHPGKGAGIWAARQVYSL
jgi:ferrochelatase